jgi:APA family basic amino acid/polyamine antiporter
MAEDGILPRQFSWLGPHSHTPVSAILLQSAATITAVLLGTYEEILSYVVVMDWLFFGLTASCLFVFRRREKLTANTRGIQRETRFQVPGHPWTTGLFAAVSWLITLNTIYKYPRNAGMALCILFAGVPAFFLLRGRARRQASSE